MKVAFLGKGDDKRLSLWYGPLSCLPYLIADFTQGTHHGISSCLYQLSQDIVYPLRFSLLERFHSCFDLFPQDWLATSQCRLLVSPTVTYNCVAVQFCKVLFSPLYNVVGFAKAFPVFVLYGVGLPFFCNSQSFYQLICFFAIVLPDVILNILTLYINPRLFYLFMLFLIFWLIALYFLAPSAVSYLPFFSALHSFHRSGCPL